MIGFGYSVAVHSVDWRRVYNRNKRPIMRSSKDTVRETVKFFHNSHEDGRGKEGLATLILI